MCRNFDPTKVPLPEVLSATALEALAKNTKGTLTLDSLAELGDSKHKFQEWEAIKAYVESGDLK